MITVLIADDSRTIRRSVRVLLDTTDDILVVGEASNGVDAVTMARQLRPDVVLMDLRMPDGDGLDAIKALSGAGVADPIAVIAYTTFHLDEYVYGALEHGAVGFLLKKNPGDVPAAIRAAVNASSLQSPAVRQRLRAVYARSNSRTATGHAAEHAAHSGDRSPATQVSASLTETLTDREFEIITELVRGQTNKQIAARLDLSVSTVKWHIANMLDKTGATDRTQLAVWANDSGLHP